MQPHPLKLKLGVLFALPLLLGGLLGCAYFRVVADSELVGVWTLTDASRPLLSKYPLSKSSTLELRRDGTFQAVDMPGEIGSLDDEWRSQNLTASGTWARADHNSLRLIFVKSTQAPSLRTPFGSTLHIGVDYGGVRLTFYRGDPDDGIVIEYEKRR